MVLEKTLAIKILHILYERDELSLSELTKGINGNWETVLRRIEELRAAGLVYTEKSKEFPFKRDIGLTTKGRKTASTLIPEVKGELGVGDRLFLALLHALGGKLKGSIKLEKFMYRIERETDIEKCFRFISHKYGPFSVDVLKTAQTLAFTGLIEIDEKIWGIEGDYEKKLVIYKLTPKGVKVARDIFNILPIDVKRGLLGFKPDAKKPLDIFLKEFYEKYPEFKKHTRLDTFVY